MYTCLCDCGTQKVLDGSRVVTGLVKTCGHTIRYWASAELQFLSSTYSTMPAPEISKTLGRSPGSVRSKAFELGLKACVTAEKICDAMGCLAKVNSRRKLCTLHYQRSYRSPPEIKQRYRAYARKHAHTLKGRLSTLVGECKRRELPMGITLHEYASLWELYEDKCGYCNTLITHGGPALDRLDNTKGIV